VKAGNNTALFINQLRALRDTLQSAATQIDGILEIADRSPLEAARQPGECPHPARMRRPAGAMGHPNRFHCDACGKDVEG